MSAADCRRRWREKNPEKIKAYRKKYKLEHREQIREYSREYDRKTPYDRYKKYGLSSEDAQKLLEQQGGKCAICGTEEWGGWHHTYCVDHDHDTGQVRGLLCTRCNAGLGHFQDDPDLLLRAAQYLT